MLNITKPMGICCITIYNFRSGLGSLLISSGGRGWEKFVWSSWLSS